METIYLEKSSKKGKKFMVLIGNKTIHFGAEGMSDYTIHKDQERMKRYISRHKSREDWSENGIKTAGFWSRWILWNLPNFEKSIKNTEKNFNIKIIFLDQEKLKSTEAKKNKIINNIYLNKMSSTLNKTKTELSNMAVADLRKLCAKRGGGATDTKAQCLAILRPHAKSPSKSKAKSPSKSKSPAKKAVGRPKATKSKSPAKLRATNANVKMCQDLIKRSKASK